MRLIMIFVAELFEFMRVRKKYWMLPIFLILLFVGFFIFFASGTAVSTLIYTLF